MGSADLLDLGRSAVVVIDLQGKLMDMVVHRDRVLAATQRLMTLADIFRRPVVLTEQYPEGLGVTHSDIRSGFDELATVKRYVKKVAFGCCGEPAFAEALNEVMPGLPPPARQFVIAGIEAHVCVMQTVLELLRQGSQVHVCWEAVSSRGEEYRRYALERMQQAGAVLTNHESVGFEWARSKDHPGFKAMNRLFREGQIT